VIKRGGRSAEAGNGMDAWLAAFTMSAGCQMVTTGKAFAQFKGLDLLVAKAN